MYVKIELSMFLSQNLHFRAENGQLDSFILYELEVRMSDVI